uniref:RRM domain-containing protein n=1 Tax=Guillardia theta TaxID=55529 RepID=A0A6U6AWR9_GUITH|mmetsp:Transcript_33860/g.106198  ORF Transcript_33860/g.106198 Transcript_33860/m.106198 type:complete len:259 (+) Transcript_33860:40-816(+)
MGDHLDDELALFEKEIESLESQKPAETSSSSAKPGGSETTTAKKPKIQYAAAPVKNYDDELMPTVASRSSGVTTLFQPSLNLSYQANPAPNSFQTYGSSIAPPAISGGANSKMPGIPDTIMRSAGGKKWSDASLLEWPKDDYRMFCGNLGNEVDDSTLARSFGKYSSFQKAKVVRDGRTSKSKGYGFVSFADPADFTRAMKEMQGKYVGNRPVKLMKSEWQERALQPGKKRPAPQQQQGEEEEDTEWWNKKASKPKKK